MDIKPFKYKDPNRLVTYEKLLTEIERVLEYVKETASTLTEAEIRDKEAMAWFKIQTQHLKLLYSRLEGIALNG